MSEASVKHVGVGVEVCEQKVAKMGRKQKSSSPSNFLGYDLVLLLFAWGILARHLAYLLKIYPEDVTQCGTHQLQ